METSTFWKPTALPSNPEAKASLSGKRNFTRLMERRSSKEAPDTFLFLLGLRQEDTRVLAKRGGGGPESQQRLEALASKERRSSTRPKNSPNKAQRGPGGETGKKGKDSPQLFTTAWS